jgi:hypothetical protein
MWIVFYPEPHMVAGLMLFDDLNQRSSELINSSLQEFGLFRREI